MPNPYQPLQSLPSLYNNKMSQPQSSSNMSTGPLNFSRTGLLAKSANDNLKSKSNVLPAGQAKTTAPATTSSTQNGTGATPAYGTPVTDSMGRTAPAMFDKNTGKPLVNPNANTTATTSVPDPTTVPPTPKPTYDSNDNGLYGKMVTDLANRSEQSGKDYQAAQAEANRVAQEQTSQAKDYAQKTNNIAGTAGFLTQQSGLQGQLNNQYNTVQGALSSQGASANSRLGAANTQQGLLQSAIGTAAGLAAPQFPSYFNPQFNPVTNTYSQTGGGPVEGATKQFQADTTKTYLQGKQNINAADGIQNQIVGTLNSNPQLNNTPVSLLTNLNELLSGQVSSGPQQLLSQQIAQYINTLGLDPATVTNIAHQEKGTLAHLLDSLRQTAQTKNESQNPENIKSGSSSSSSTGGSKGGNMFGSFF